MESTKGRDALRPAHGSNLSPTSVDSHGRPYLIPNQLQIPNRGHCFTRLLNE